MDTGHKVSFSPKDRDNEDDNDIEVLSEKCLPMESNHRPLRKPRKSILDDIKFFQDAARRKKFTRWVIVLGVIFIFMSGILLIVTLNMSSDIDDKVRDSNELLQKHLDSMSKVKGHTVPDSNSTRTKATLLL